MEIRRILVVLLLGLLSLSSLANGDPVQYESMLFRSVNPMPRKVSHISVEREDLNIKLGYYTTVRAKYTLYNSSDTTETIDYGFPVDYYGASEKYRNSGYTECYYSERIYTLGWRDDYIKELHFVFNGDTLSHTMSDEVVLKRGVLEKDEREGMTDKEVADIISSGSISRRWFYTNFTIKAKEKVVLEVTYSLRNHCGSLPEVYGYERSHCSYYLEYDMTPASNWGNGLAAQFNIEIDASDASYGESAKNVLSGPCAIPFKVDGEFLRYSTKNFAFAKSKPISLWYWLKYDEGYYRLIESQKIAPDSFTITASKEVSAYPLSNLVDGDVTTAWAVPYEKGDSLTISFDKPITGQFEFVMLGGYYKNSKTYEQNARPKIVVQRDYDENGLNNCGYNVSREIEDRAYKEVNGRNFYDQSYRFRFGFNDQNVEKVTLRFDDVFEGTKYNDLCVSEIMILNIDPFTQNN